MNNIFSSRIHHYGFPCIYFILRVAALISNEVGGLLVELGLIPGRYTRFVVGSCTAQVALMGAAS